MPVSFDPNFLLGAGAHVTWISSEPVPQILIEWKLDPTVLDLSTTTFSVERSEDYSFASYRTLTSGRSWSLPHEYMDTTAPLGDFTRKLYYRVRAVRPGDDDVLSQATTWEGNPDFVAQEIISRHDMMLREYQGVPFVYWKQRTFGPRCSECWDPISKRSKTAKCGTCFGTGFALPYHDPVGVWLSNETSDEMLSAANVRQTPEGQIVVWYTRFPLYVPGDILLEAQTGKRFRVESRKIAAKKRGVIIQQVLVCAELDRTMAQFKLAVPQATIQSLVASLKAERLLHEF
jgi:hypothetical protein